MDYLSTTLVSNTLTQTKADLQVGATHCIGDDDSHSGSPLNKKRKTGEWKKKKTNDKDFKKYKPKHPLTC
jgi:hypothetical protein